MADSERLCAMEPHLVEKISVANGLHPWKTEANSFFEPLKRQTKIAADATLSFYFYLSKEIRLIVSCDFFAEDSHEISSLIFSEKQ